MFGKKSLEDILGGFTKTLKELDDHIFHHNKQAVIKQAQVASLNEQIDTHTAQVAQATAVSANIAALLNQPTAPATVTTTVATPAPSATPTETQ